MSSLILSAYAQIVDPACSAVFNKSQETISVKSKDSVGTSSALLKWSAVYGSSYYLFAVSDTENFKNKKIFKLKTNEFDIKLFPNRTYYWKVNAYDEKNKIISCKTENPFPILLSLKEKTTPTVAQNPMKAVEYIPASDEDIRVSQAVSPVPKKAVITIDSLPEWNNSLKVWFATEVGFLNFQQNNPIVGSASSSGLIFPSAAIHVQTRDYGKNYFKFMAQQMLGDFATKSDTISILDKEFQWLTLKAEAYRRLSQFELKKRRTDLIFHLGAGQLKTPYFLAVNPAIMSVRSMKTLVLPIGISLETEIKKNWSYHADLTYSHALSASGQNLSSAELGSFLLVDTQLGARYHSARGLFYGGTFKTSYWNFKETLNSENFVAPGDRQVTYFAAEFCIGSVF